MYTISINDKVHSITKLDLSNNTFSATINNKVINGDLIKINSRQFHLIVGSTSLELDLIKHDPLEKTFDIKLNSSRFQLKLKDKYDELLHSLGLDTLTSHKISDIKAPMPGMVLNVLVNEGDQVKKGDALIVLEAMKMENILKSPSDGTIKKIVAKKGKPVEKNEILIQF